MSAVMGTTVDKIWTKKNGKNTEIGFTQSYLDEIVSECWHITQASRTRVREKSPLLTVETNEAQFTIMSPIAGEFLFFNDMAMNFPDKLKESDVVCILGEREAVQLKKPPGAILGLYDTPIIFDWFAAEAIAGQLQQEEE